jgi:hypothetical protein
MNHHQWNVKVVRTIPYAYAPITQPKSHEQDSKKVYKERVLRRYKTVLFRQRPLVWRVKVKEEGNHKTQKTIRQDTRGTNEKPIKHTEVNNKIQNKKAKQVWRIKPSAYFELWDTIKELSRKLEEALEREKAMIKEAATRRRKGDRES